MIEPFKQMVRMLREKRQESAFISTWGFDDHLSSRLSAVDDATHTVNSIPPLPER
ncbi:hypothetical protein [Neorhizobium lilium]|uniref:hypothetical protein n=1 Tax=Neorhizobium lilium TaxID=2503024 RepID=UPI0013E3FB6D|nr:hypothetical protein [Neorhizobium lilium]